MNICISILVDRVREIARDLSEILKNEAKLSLTLLISLFKIFLKSLEA